MPRGPPKKPDKVSAVNTSLQGQKPRGRPKKTDIVNAESSVSHYSKDKEKLSDWTKDEDVQKWYWLNSGNRTEEFVYWLRNVRMNFGQKRFHFLKNPGYPGCPKKIWAFDIPFLQGSRRKILVSTTDFQYLGSNWDIWGKNRIVGNRCWSIPVSP